MPFPRERERWRQTFLWWPRQPACPWCAPTCCGNALPPAPQKKRSEGLKAGRAWKWCKVLVKLLVHKRMHCSLSLKEETFHLSTTWNVKVRRVTLTHTNEAKTRTRAIRLVQHEILRLKACSKSTSVRCSDASMFSMCSLMSAIKPLMYFSVIALLPACTCE